MLGLIINSTK